MLSPDKTNAPNQRKTVKISHFLSQQTHHLSASSIHLHFVSLPVIRSSILSDLSLSQTSLPLLELLVTKSHCLQVQLVSTISALSSFLDTLQAVADTASNSKGDIVIRSLQNMRDKEISYPFTPHHQHQECHNLSASDVVIIFRSLLTSASLIMLVYLEENTFIEQELLLHTRMSDCCRITCVQFVLYYNKNVQCP